LYDFWVFSNGIKSFDVLIAVLVHLQAQSSQLFEFARHQVYFFYNNRSVRKILFSNNATWQQCYFCDFFLFLLYSEMKEGKIWNKRKFLVQFSKGERVSVTSLFLKV